MFGVSKKSCVRHAQHMATFVLNLQVAFLRAGVSWLLHDKRSSLLRYACVSTMFDETSQKLMCELRPNTQRTTELAMLLPIAESAAVFPTADVVECRQHGGKFGKWGARRPLTRKPTGADKLMQPGLRQSVKLNLNVTKITIQWQECDDLVPKVVEIVCPPPIELADGKAKSLWNALRGHAVMRDIVEFKEALLHRCEADGGLAVDVDQCDDASANALYFAATAQKLQTDAPLRVRVRLKCMNHQAHHAQLAPIGVSSIFETSLVSGPISNITEQRNSTQINPPSCFVYTHSLAPSPCTLPLPSFSRRRGYHIEPP